MAIRPPKIAKEIERIKAPNNPTLGGTPAIAENAIASGIIAKATTSPERIFREGDKNFSFADKLFNFKTTLLLSCLIRYENLYFQG